MTCLLSIKSTKKIWNQMYILMFDFTILISSSKDSMKKLKWDQPLFITSIYINSCRQSYKKQVDKNRQYKVTCTIEYRPWIV